MNLNELDSVEIDPTKQEEAKKYSKIRRRLTLVDLLIGLVYLLLWLFMGWSLDLKSVLLGFSSNDWFLVLSYAIIFGGIFFLLNLPLSYYSGYILPHRFELSNQNLKGWVIDQIKGLLISLLLGGVLIEIAYAIFRRYPENWWIWLVVFLLVFNVLLANLAPVILFPIFYKFEPLEEEHADLAQRLIVLAERAGAHVRGVYTFDMSKRTKEANAGLTGLGNTRRIIIGDTLLENFSDDEIETILAHELGHHVNKDVVLGITFQTILTFGGMYIASKLMLLGNIHFGFSGASDVAAMPLLGLVLSVYGIITMPIENAYSRWRERLADQYALQTTKKGLAYASALKRLANQNLAEVEPEPWVEFLLYSHPPLGKRIKMALNSETQPSK